MLSEKETERFSRHLVLPEIGESGQLNLKKAKVLVIGAGGLGCPVLQYLVAAGVGIIGIADNDTVDVSNLQRQVLFSEKDLGISKAETAAKKLSEQNSLTEITAHKCYLDPSNALDIIARYDIVVDGSDNFPTRYLVSDACVILKKPLVFGSIFKFEGQVSVFNFNGGPTYRCLYPESPLPGSMPSCSEVGVLGVLPGITGCLMANEALKMIIGIGDVLSGRLLAFDALKMTFDTFSFEKNNSNTVITALGNYENYCEENVSEITAVELKKKMTRKEEFQLIDVREQEEYDRGNLGAVLIPLSQLTNNTSKIRKDVPVIVYCQAGSRSRKAVQLLRERGFVNLQSLKNGLLDF